MSEKRLLEITLTINKLDGPLVVFGYLLSLSESDMYSFLNYVKGSQYKDINLYDAVKMFSKKYLDGKEIRDVDSEIKNFGYAEGNFEDFFIKSGFSMNHTYNDEVVSVENKRK